MLGFFNHSNKCCDFTFYLIRASAGVHLPRSAFGWQHLFVYPCHTVFYHSHFLSATTHSATYCQAWHRCSVSLWELQEWLNHLSLLFPWRKAVLPLLYPVLGEYEVLLWSSFSLFWNFIWTFETQYIQFSRASWAPLDVFLFACLCI